MIVSASDNLKCDMETLTGNKSLELRQITR